MIYIYFPLVKLKKKSVTALCALGRATVS